MNKELAHELLKKVRDDYQKIAEHFSQTRFAPWSEFSLFKKYVKPSSTVLDAGCGNGRLLDSFKDLQVDYTGIDASPRLVKLAQDKYPGEKFIIGDLISLPFSDKQFNSLFCIATFHHIPSQDLRTTVIKEFKRVLKNNGQLIITVWNFWQPKFWRLLIKYTILKLVGKNQMDLGDFLMPWKNPQGKIMINRYVHAFTLSELATLLKENNFKIIKSFYSRKGYPASWLSGFNLNIIARLEI